MPNDEFVNHVNKYLFGGKLEKRYVEALVHEMNSGRKSKAEILSDVLTNPEFYKLQILIRLGKGLQEEEFSKLLAKYRNNTIELRRVLNIILKTQT